MRNKFTTIKERVVQIAEYQNESKESFFSNIGMTSANFRGKAKETPLNSNAIENIITKYPTINLHWLITGNGEMNKDFTLEDLKQTNDLKRLNLDKKFNLRTDNDIANQNIPLYNIEASAGLVELFQNHSDNTPIDSLHIPNLPKCDGAVFVTGDSMYPLLKSGDIVAYKQINDFSTEIFWGEMYLISVEVASEEYISVKYVQKSEKGVEYIKLVSQNQHHQPKDVHLDKVRAMALIKASVRINSMG